MGRILLNRQADGFARVLFPCNTKIERCCLAATLRASARDTDRPWGGLCDLKTFRQPIRAHAAEGHIGRDRSPAHECGHFFRH